MLHHSAHTVFFQAHSARTCTVPYSSYSTSCTVALYSATRSTGILASQTATSVTLRRDGNKTETILRSQLEELTGTGRSLMPDGFEKKISVSEMRDLIAYLQEAAQPTGDPPLHIGTLPGLIEPDDDSH